MQTRSTISLLIVALSAGIVSCSDLNAPSPTFEQSVVCNLTAYVTTQRIHLFRITSVDDPGPSFPFFSPSTNDARFVPYAIENATVFVEDETQQRVLFDFSSDSLFGAIVGRPYKNRDAFSVQPGGRYVLSAATPFGTITGSTTVPGDFSILSPSNNQVFSRGATVRIVWTKSSHAFGYHVKATDEDSRSPITTSTLVNDTTYSIRFDPDFRISGAITIQVFAYDKNYDDHRSKVVPRAGITNAYGCFGSSLLQTVRIRVQ